MSSSVEIRWLRATMNSVNGAGVEHWYFNATDKEIKYLTFVYVPYNQVGDQVQCTMSRKSEVSCKLTGPIKPYHENNVKWEALWYNPTVTKIELVQIHIDYMDGSEETIDGADVVDMSDKQSVYYEKVEKPAEEERAEREKQLAIQLAESEKKAAEKKAIDDRNNELATAYLCFKVFSCFKKMKDDDEMKFHVNQGLWLFIFEVIGIICAIISGFATLLSLVFEGLAIFLSIKGFKETREGKRFEIPLISKIKLIK